MLTALHLASSATSPKILGHFIKTVQLSRSCYPSLTQLRDLPQAYSTRIKTYGVEEDNTAQKHLDRFNDFCDLEEIDHEDAKLRLFAQSFSGEVKKWFRGLQAGSIHDFQKFEIVFLGKWEKKRNSLQLLT